MRDGCFIYSAQISTDSLAWFPWQGRISVVGGSCQPLYFILDQRLMGKLFQDLFLSALENSASGLLTGATGPEGFFFLI